MDVKVIGPSFPGGPRSGDPVEYVRNDIESGEQDQAEKQHLRRAFIKQAGAERNEEQSDTRPHEKHYSCGHKTEEFSEKRRYHPERKVVGKRRRSGAEICRDGGILLCGEIVDNGPLILDQIIEDRVSDAVVGRAASEFADTAPVKKDRDQDNNKNQIRRIDSYRSFGFLQRNGVLFHAPHGKVNGTDHGYRKKDGPMDLQVPGKEDHDRKRQIDKRCQIETFYADG